MQTCSSSCSSRASCPSSESDPFFARQHRIVLRNCGVVDPESLEDYLARDGYVGFARAIGTMGPGQVVDVMKRSGLRGRGGAGFLTGLEWELTRRSPGDVRYVICNADEGDPGAFVDRSILEGDPHGVLEGMLIAGYAIGAREGYVYCRGEYSLALRRLRLAVEQAREHGLLGEDILGKGFSFELHLKEGAGAFVCGEETALIAALEGRRGEPRPRPPFPASVGLWGKPTCINNVETLANVPPILARGAEWFAAIGLGNSQGTKVFALSGQVQRVGPVEVPMGTPLGDVVFDVGGGVASGRRLKGVHVGGPLGGCLPASQLNTPIDYDSLAAAGATMGSGGLVVLDETTCVVDLARFFLSFIQGESCGQCVPCRLGSRRMVEVLTRITEGRGRPEDLDALQALARAMASSSLCSLGQLAPNPVLSTLRYFRDEYLAHVVEKRCPAGACKELTFSPCHNACPLHTNVPAVAALVAAGRDDEALAVVREANPLPAVCAHLCVRYCERRCSRGADGAVAFRDLVRFLASGAAERPWTPDRLEGAKRERVAVVGSGPTGLSAAYELARRGYPVTVFEALPVAGGMLAVGVPEFRLPKRVLRAEIAAICRLGVEIRLSSPLGPRLTIDDLMAQGHAAVLLAIGAHAPARLGVEGEDLPGVVSAAVLLRRLNLGQRVEVGGRVVVVGGGNAAVDAARACLRLGAGEVTVVYRRSRADMPALPDEVAAAEAEGVRLELLATPTRILAGDGRAAGVECQRVTPGELDAGGRRRPVPAPGTEFPLPADTVVVAVGQVPDLRWLIGEGRLAATRTGRLQVDPATLATSRPGVFAGGDVVDQPATVVDAIAAGRRAALAIHRYLQGQACPEPLPPKRGATPGPATFTIDESATQREPAPVAPADVRRRSFAEVAGVYDAGVARREAARCLRCDLAGAGAARGVQADGRR